MSSAPSILVYGRDQSLLESRVKVLASAGYGVWKAFDQAQLSQAVVLHEADLLLLCHSLSTEDCEQALQVTHMKRPTTKILVMLAHASGCPSSMADAFVNATDGPAKLLEAVHRLIGVGLRKNVPQHQT